MARHNEIGKLGEDIACEFLTDKGLNIVARNVRKPYGEIDIVARETNAKYRFVEVKSVSCGTPQKEGYRPEENVHAHKIKRLKRIIEVYLLSHNVPEWQFDIITVSIDEVTKTAKVKHLENIVLGS